jgi:hypothetical protein
MQIINPATEEREAFSRRTVAPLMMMLECFAPKKGGRAAQED